MRTVLTAFLFLNLSTSTFAQGYSVDTTFKINNQVLHISTKNIDSNLVLLNSSYIHKTALYDTVDAAGLANIEFPDFDNDGYPDILLTYFGNNPTYYLYLFDRASKHFKSILNYMSFPDAVQLKTNPKYYYSYYHDGCADMDWVSDLFKIVDFKIVHVGHIDAQGCQDETQAINIFKITNNDEEHGKLITKLPYIKTLNKFDDKWEFIKKYWSENFKKFE